ncbi:unnamed protein product [Absidia cylindrospora]
MTKDTPVEQRFEGLSLKDTQQQQKPFEIVLVDIRQCLYGEIHCDKMPLNDKGLKYVALSYRWGEWKETLIDTRLGYAASITSFYLQDFRKLCGKIAKESDLQPTGPYSFLFRLRIEH